MTTLVPDKILYPNLSQDEDTLRYGFIISFPQVNEIYRPFLTSSFQSLSAIGEPLEIAEAIQDMGVQYEIRSSVLTFPTKQDAKKASQYIASCVKLSNIETSIYEFNKQNFFGRKDAFRDCYPDLDDAELLKQVIQEEQALRNLS